MSPLDQSRPEPRPLFGAQDHRKDIQLPGALGTSPVIDHIVRDAVIRQKLLRALTPLPQRIRAHRFDPRDKAAPVRARVALGIQDLVVNSGWRTVGRKQRRRRRRKILCDRGIHEAQAA